MTGAVYFLSDDYWHAAEGVFLLLLSVALISWGMFQIAFHDNGCKNCDTESGKRPIYIALAVVVLGWLVCIYGGLLLLPALDNIASS
jgi:hypothetical protein